MNAKALKIVGRWITRVVLLALAVLVAGAVMVLTVLPRATHGAALTVLTGSMTPTIAVGSIVLDRPVDPGTLHVGDIATYQKTPGVAEFITHRIVAINTKTTPTTFTFKGDANRGPDLDPVPATAIRGKVWFHLPYLGDVRDALHAKGGLVLLAFIALIGYAITQGVGLFRDRREKSSAGIQQSSANAAAGSPAAPLEPTADANVDYDARVPRHVVLATFHDGLQGRLSRESITWLLGGTVVEEDERSFTIVVLVPLEKARRTNALLETLEPISVESLIAMPADSHAGTSIGSVDVAAPTTRPDRDLVPTAAAANA